MREATREELEVLKAAQLVLKSMMEDEIETHWSGLTVHRLARHTLEEVIAGNGPKTIFITSDDEGNAYHKLLYSVDTNPSSSDLILLKENNPCMEDYKDEDIALLG